MRSPLWLFVSVIQVRGGDSGVVLVSGQDTFSTDHAKENGAVPSVALLEQSLAVNLINPSAPFAITEG